MIQRRAAMFLLVCLVGCSNIVQPPAHPPVPVTVFLTDEGIHSSVLMPIDDGRYIEYALGDWQYAALDKHDFFHTVGALFFSEQGALGRRYLKLNLAEKPMAPELQDIKIYPMRVDSTKIKSTEALLNRRFEAGKDPNENPENHFVFVKVDEGYGFFHNCNTLTKQTLRELDCKVSDRSTFAMYDVQK